MNKHATQVIDALGGTASVARLCEISMPSVSDWKKYGIPQARMMYIKAMYRRFLKGIDLEAATAPARQQARNTEVVG